jgi:hypothetical protein
MDAVKWLLAEMRIKAIARGEFARVMERHWEPVELDDDLLPDFARAIPQQTRFRFLASGEANADIAYSNERIPSGRLVGGFDVYRNAPDDPVRFNKDWYAVVDPDDGSDHLLVDGPQKDREHWLDEIPRRYDGVRILSASRKSSD